MRTKTDTLTTFIGVSAIILVSLLGIRCGRRNKAEDLTLPDQWKFQTGDNSIGLKFGAQVLAVDQSLNPEITDLDKLSIGDPMLKSLPSSLLPEGWFGKQLFSAKAFYDGKLVNLKLVPYAEGSQTGGDIRVWI